MRRCILFVMLIVYSTMLAAQARPALEKEQLAAMVYCINSKATELGAPLLTVRSGEVRVRYRLAKHSFAYPDGTTASVGRDDEVRLVFYGTEDSTASIYDLFLSTGQSTKIEIGRPATFRKVHGKWQSGDNPGGMATDWFLRDLLRTLSQEKATEVPIYPVDGKGAQVSCSLLSVK